MQAFFIKKYVWYRFRLDKEYWKGLKT